MHDQSPLDTLPIRSIEMPRSLRATGL